jgi:hypothetical protein
MPRHRKSYTLIPRKIKSGKHVWYYRTYDEYGQRTVARSTGQTNKTLAENYCDELLRRGELVPVKDVSFNDFASIWWVWDKCEYIRGRLARSKSGKPRISQSYAKEMRSVLEQYILPPFGNYELERITPRHIETWLFELQDRGLSHKRINNMGHGRTADYPTAPAQIPACGIPTPGSSVILASVIRQNETQGSFGSSSAPQSGEALTYTNQYCLV